MRGLFAGVWMMVFLGCGLLIQDVSAQGGYAFGVKLGPTAGLQRWSSFNRDALFKYHADLYIESLEDEADNSFSLFASAGYHARGSAIRIQATEVYDFNTGTWRPVDRRTQEFRFNNISVVVGGKKKFDMGNAGTKGYYSVGLRGEYTINTNLEQYEQDNNPFSLLFFPNDLGVKRWMYGVSIGGGFEFPFGDLFGGIVELNVQPDFSQQYYRPPLVNVSDPFRPGQVRNYPEERIVNISVELSFGIRLIHRYEYVEEGEIEESDMW